jgi:hypothetical protein
MAKVNLYPIFSEFLKLLNSRGVRYLVIGGYAVIYYGYARVTGDLDVWVSTDAANARAISLIMQEFWGFPASAVPPKLFRKKGKMLIFGARPTRIDILTSPSGVEFEAAYARRRTVDWDGIDVPLIDFADLKANKSASGRLKDLTDLENLPPTAPIIKAAPTKKRWTGKK